MPTNVTPEYKKAEEAYRKAREPKDRLDCLKEMLRTIPKHKGTEHLQSDIKTRIKQLTEELTGPKKGGRRSGPSHVVRPDGAAQLCLIGSPNAGKSSLHARLTGSHSDVGPYPYTTHLPIPGMLPYEDIQFQLVDLPPVSSDFLEPWLVNALQHADGVLLVIDVSDPECLEQVPVILERLKEKKVYLRAAWPGLDQVKPQVPDDADDPFRLDLPTVLIANKSDLDPDPEEVAILEELLGLRFPALTMSAETGDGDRPRLHQDARQTGRCRQAFHGASWRHDSRRRAPCAQGHSAGIEVRTHVGHRGIRWPASWIRPSRLRRRPCRAACVGHSIG